MDPRRKNSWDAFKPAGGRFEDRPRLTTAQRIYTAAATLILGLVFAFFAACGIMFFVLGFSTSRLIAFFHFGGSGWFYPGVFMGALAWAIWNWIRGLREEATTRDRIEHHRSRSLAPWKSRPPDQEDDEPASKIDE